MSSRTVRFRSMVLIATVAVAMLTGCAKQQGAVSLEAAPLAGPGAASLGSKKFSLFAMFSMESMGSLWAVKSARAGVAAFNQLKLCNDTLKFINDQGEQVTVNGSGDPSVGQGLLSFDGSSVNVSQIGSLDLPAGTVISEIDITFAVKPSVCQGVNYAVRFDDGINGIKDITQNTAFKFMFPAGGVQVTGEAQTLTLMFGDIVNGMVGLGASLDNSTIQTVNVGQAR